MSSLEKLQTAKGLDDIAAILKYRRHRLSYLLYHLPASEKYTEFKIHKRNGETRHILAPAPKLKLLQRRLADLLYSVLKETSKGAEKHRPLSHGFSKGLSIITNANIHKRRRYVLSLDLKDFFHSINFGRVRGVLIKDKRFSLNDKVATIIAQIACHNHVLPQGSPCSPVISNIVAHLLDIKLVQFAKMHKCSYSRYADDITFSTNNKVFPADIAFPTPEIQGKSGNWTLGAALLKIISKTGYEVNASKTRMQFRGSRQITTGLLVNEKPNILPEYYRTTRAMCWSLFNKGNYYKTFSENFSNKFLSKSDKKEELINLNCLQGRIGYVYHVRNHSDKRDPIEKRQQESATRKLYSKFLFYKYFVAPDKPVIIPEGKTDSIYLKAAIEKLTDYHPKLGYFEKEKFRSTIRFMKFSQTVRDFFKLGNGAGDLHHFIRQYPIILRGYGHRPMAYPIIVLVDNDEGPKETFLAAKKLSKKDVSLTSTEEFYRLTENLYLIKTPEIGEKGKSCIEDFFDPKLFETKINGKIFDPAKPHGEEGKYGKAIFAENVVKAQKNTIDFSNFRSLLDRIISVLNDYVENPPTPTNSSKFKTFNTIPAQQPLSLQPSLSPSINKRNENYGASEPELKTID